MRQILSRSLLTVAAASSVLAVTGGYANADSAAQGGAEGSPGVLSGNSVEIPVHVPVNACGNTVDAVALLNPAFGNSCANDAEVETPATPVVPGPRHAKPPAAAPRTPVAPSAPAVAPAVHQPRLAETGTSAAGTGAAAAGGAALLLGGAVLYRRSARVSRIRRTYS